MDNEYLNDRLRKKFFWARLLVLAALLAVMATVVPDAAQAVANSNIRIGIARGVTSGKLYGSGIVVRTAKGHDMPVANGAAVSAAGANVKIGGKTMSLPLTITAKSGLGWGKRRYRGTLRIIRAGRGFTVVNVLPLESYVRGVVGLEVSPKWHPEALKVQAVLARTYAEANRGRYEKDGYDLTDTIESQVYGGLSAETPTTEAAVAATEGQILTYGGAPARVYYHSDSGGSTASGADVWGSEIPYLRAVDDLVVPESPRANWKLTLTPAQITAAAKKAGLRVGDVRSMEVVRRDPFGRAVTLRFKGSHSTAELSAHAFRMAVGSTVLWSTNFALYGDGSSPKYRDKKITVIRTGQQRDLTQMKPGAQDAPVQAQKQAVPYVGGRTQDPLIEMTQADVFTKDEIYDMLFHPEKRDEYIRIGRERMGGRPAAEPRQETPVPAKTEPQGSRKDIVVKVPVDSEVRGRAHFAGHGSGHGVGLSQWGSKMMADRGARCEEILIHYFPGTALSR